MRCSPTITPDEIHPERKWDLTQGLDTIGVVERFDWPEGCRFTGTPFELWTPSHKTGTPVPRFATLQEAADHADTLAEQRARTSTLKPYEAHRETYRGSTIVITRHPARVSEHTRSFAHYAITVDGRYMECPKGYLDTVIAKVRGKIDTARADAELLPRLVALIDARRGGKDLAPLDGAPQVDDVVYVWAQGRYRRGLVTKLGRTNVTVSYTTASSQGAVYHKADKPADLRV